ncbi:MAG: molybdate ABC transporter permease subunit [Chloroflexi bacterium]|nr:MAG: molybdate ABC transporter permease subunit [Chloroflexota bacterium]
MGEIDWFPLWLSLRVATVATLLVLLTGIPAAWLLARYEFPGKEILNGLTSLPLVLPPTVLGYYLLVLLGNQSPLGRWLDDIGWPLVFTWRGAAVASAVASFPLMAQTARSGFEGIDRRLEDMGRVLGRSNLYIFWRVTLPLAWPSIVAGMALSFARALGDFGATLMVAGNIPGRTQTMSLRIFDLIQANRQGEANVMVLVMTAVAVVLLFVAQYFTHQLHRHLK